MLNASFVTADDESGEDKRTSGGYFASGLALVVILLLSALAYSSLALSWPKFSRAEVFFAECVREMFQAGNLVTPLYHGTPFFDKPILAYWFIAASYKIAGINHFAARLPSIFFAIATIALTAKAGKRLFGAAQGNMAAAVLASSFMFLSFANLCMSDMTLVFFDAASLSLLYLSLLDEKKRSILLYLAALSMGLAFLTKGPVGIVLPAMSFAVYLSISRQWKKIELVKHVLPCSLILLGAGVPWFMAAFRQNGAGALSYFFIHENLERFAAATYDTHRPFWFMLQSFLTGLLPWSVFIPFALFDSVKTLKQKDAQSAATAAIAASPHVYLWLWIAVVIGFFSISRGKIDYYALPAYPAAALLIGAYLTKVCRNLSAPAVVSGWLLGTAMLLAGIISVVYLPEIFVREQISFWGVLPAILTGTGTLMICSCLKKQFYATFKLLFVAICLSSLAVSFQLYPWITGKQAVLKYIPYIRSLKEDDRIGVYSSLANWIDEITYQTDCEPMRIDSIKMAEQFLRAKSRCLLLIQEGEFKELSADSQKKFRLIARNPFIPRSLNPVYFISKGQKLAENNELLLVSNFEPGPLAN